MDALDHSVSTRAARRSDAADIASLTAQLGYDVETPALDARLTSLLARADQRVVVAEAEGRVVGWLHAAIFEDIETDPYVVIAGLVVDRSHRRLGIGRTLIAECEEWAKGQQCSVVRLWSSAGRTAAHRFYERLGYTNIKTQYSFVKSVGRDRDDFSGFIPRIDGESS
jgi:GNAT superfamily N-acetyltransferase